MDPHTRRYKEAFAATRRAVNAADPDDLVGLAPPDEYDDLVGRLMPLVLGPHQPDLDDIATVAGGGAEAAPEWLRKLTSDLQRLHDRYSRGG